VASSPWANPRALRRGAVEEAGRSLEEVRPIRDEIDALVESLLTDLLPNR
jgi:hypothetical protein